ncbi:hypothetical protein RIVM261_058410 [Rivularia sp. IAM M-261]|nr:hypothetical protein RIVM261_058410 [Rivularia sp. IAM M-261]
MGTQSNLPNIPTTTSNSSEVKQAATKATIDVASEMQPEKTVLDKLPPKPDYPRYRVRPEQPIILASLDPDECEEYKKRSTLKRNLKTNVSVFKIYKNVCMQNISVAC